jgi:hypothetical protein
MKTAKWLPGLDRSSFIENDDAAVATVRYIAPLPEARTRADEIVAAYDKSKNWKSRTYRAAERAKDEAFDISHDLENQITELQATSFQGLAAKARCVEILGMDSDLARSIVDDLLEMAGTAA